MLTGFPPASCLGFSKELAVVLMRAGGLRAAPNGLEVDDDVDKFFVIGAFFSATGADLLTFYSSSLFFTSFSSYFFLAAAA